MASPRWRPRSGSSRHWPTARDVTLMVLEARGDRATAGDIARRFACSWPTTTRHLEVLEEAGLVRVEQQGRERHYELDRERLREVVGGWIEALDGGR